MDVSLQQILQTAQVSDLKRLGKFLEVKHFVEAQLFLKLGANGWNSLFLRLRLLGALAEEGRECARDISNAQPYPAVRHEVSKRIGFQITARNFTELRAALNQLSKGSTRPEFDPYERFEQKKLKNFISSSRLEGIEIPVFDEKASLEKILAKHGRPLNG
ncbi:YhfG family protein [Pseudomonas sp. Fl4BN1]|uniref:YhfG family protein n=1 Tax=Pseudomonas sp. Fl4BN1 TaxID=2697651 RepID=UPI0015B3A397|nr:YhfG family protein [Pseudomonas sp. Fl4BN1]